MSAFTLVGRSRTGGINPNDHRVYLYREYLRILAKHQPSVFVMENVKGILSSKVNGKPVFEMILGDLQMPTQALGIKSQKGKRYHLFSLVKPPQGADLYGRPIFDRNDFVIKCEEYGIPQARHRVILLGIREDLVQNFPPVLEQQPTVSVSQVLSGLPRLRSGISRSQDSSEIWQETLKSARKQSWFQELRDAGRNKLADFIESVSGKIGKPRGGRGNEFISHDPKTCHLGVEWYLDSRLGGVCNHSTRSHIVSDLYRYLFASCFAQIEKRSPKLQDFPEGLLPNHNNVQKGVASQHFADRFRV